MRNMWKIGLVVALVLLIGGAALTVTGGVQTAVREVRKFLLIPMTNAEAAQNALDYTYKTVHVLREPPQVIVSRKVTGLEIAKLGLGDFGQTTGTSHYNIVLVKGDFDIRGAWPGSSDAVTAITYICYIYEPGTDIPTMISAAPNGSTFQALLTKL